MIPASALAPVTRLREAPGAFDGTGRWVPGAVTETTLYASVQPLGLEDDPTEGGDQYRDRLRAFVPYLERTAQTVDALGWGGDTLLWGAARLTWVGSGGLAEADTAPLVAAVEGSGGDRVRLADGRTFKVTVTEAWPGSHVEAELLREP